MKINEKKLLNQSKQKNSKIINILKSKTCCFTGHRPQNLPWGENEEDFRCQLMRIHLKDEIIKSINYGYVYFISGIALGFDIIAAETVLQLKKDFPQIKLIAALPCKDQYKLWKNYQIERYQEILSKCDSIRCLYETYNNKCMLERNMYMLNNSSQVISLYNGKGGGTLYTLKKAKEIGLKIILIKCNLI